MSGEQRGLVVVNGQVQLQECSLYKHAVPILDRHHICPDSWFVAAGKPVNTPFADLCPNHHSATHAAIDGIIKKEDISLIPPRCRTLAWQAFDIAQQQGLTPAPTL